MNRRGWLIWGGANLFWLLIVPVLFAVWLQWEIDREYRNGWRVTTDGDSPTIPLVGFIVLNTALVVLFNLALGLYNYVSSRRRARAA